MGTFWTGHTSWGECTALAEPSRVPITLTPTPELPLTATPLPTVREDECVGNDRPDGCSCVIHGWCQSGSFCINGVCRPADNCAVGQSRACWVDGQAGKQVCIKNSLVGFTYWADCSKTEEEFKPTETPTLTQTPKLTPTPTPTMYEDTCEGNCVSPMYCATTRMGGKCPTGLICCARSDQVTPTVTSKPTAIPTAEPTSIPYRECSWCTNQAQCLSSGCSWEGRSSYCAVEGDGCCECGGEDKETDGGGGPSQSMVWFNGTVWDGGRRWSGLGGRFGEGDWKHDWENSKVECQKARGVGFEASRNIRLEWQEDELGGHFNVRVYKDRRFDLILKLPEGCGYECDSWRVIDRGENLDDSKLVAEGKGCQVSLMPETKDWQTGVEFYIRAQKGKKGQCAYCETNRRGDANCDGQIDIYDISIWRDEYQQSNGGQTARDDWRADFNCDGVVNVDDRSMWREEYRLNFGK